MLSGIKTVNAQNQFAFLNNPNSSQNWALGGQVVTAANNKFANFQDNPALLSENDLYKMTVNQSFYLANANFSSISYATQFKRTNVGFFSQYLNYGKFNLTDPSGNLLGEFTAKDFAIGASVAKQSGNIQIGLNIKLASSAIENYASFALLSDLGAVFKHPKKDFQLGMLIKNFGVGLKSYIPNQPIILPFDVKFGTTFKPQFMPLQFTITLNSIQEFFNNSTQTSSKNSFSTIKNHFAVGTEILISKAIQLQIGYKIQNSQLAGNTYGTSSGLGFGGIFSTQKISFGYAYSTFHVSGGVHTLSLAMQTKNKTKN